MIDFSFEKTQKLSVQPNRILSNKIKINIGRYDLSYMGVKLGISHQGKNYCGCLKKKCRGKYLEVRERM
jgi:hypothetical protein